MTAGSRTAQGSVRPKRWRPAPAIRVSIALHLACALALAAAPSQWPWIVGALAANHFVLFLAALRTRGTLLGPNLTRLPATACARGEIALTFDDGPDLEITPRVLDLLDRYRMKASFFCIGEKAAAFPALVEEIARRGHSVENHSASHSHAFAFFGPLRLGREIDAAQETLTRITHRPPRCFRAPAGFRNPFLDPVLARRGLQYVSWTRRGYDTSCRDPDVVLARLTRDLGAGDVLLLHDGNAARTKEGDAVVLAVLPRLLERLAGERLTSVALTVLGYPESQPTVHGAPRA